MNYTKQLFFIILILVVQTAFGQDSVSFPVKIDAEGFQEVIAKVDNIYISGQPTAEALANLRSEGVTTVVNLRTEREMSNRDNVPFDEGAVVDSLGMQYIHIPLGGADFPYNNEALLKFAGAIDNAEGKVLLHCTVAWRASHMWAAYLIQYKGFSPDKAIEHAKGINFGQLPVEGLLGKKLKVDFE
jgi:uncharacterized protein (TIGR01244 family)